MEKNSNRTNNNDRKPWGNVLASVPTGHRNENGEDETRLVSIGKVWKTDKGFSAAIDVIPIAWMRSTLQIRLVMLPIERDDR